MSKTTNKIEMVQAFDYYKDREYYKIVPTFLWSTHTLLKTDRLKNWKQWNIVCEEMPDKIIVNGESYKLIKENE